MKRCAHWLGAIIILTVIFGTIYGTSQQTLRLSAYDPQTGSAEAVAALLNGGQDPSRLNGTMIDLKHSLEPFVIVYDKTGHPISGNGYLNGKLPVIPVGVLNHATVDNDDFVTWQPQSGVRVAAVAVKANNYYVVGGRSLREVEKRETTVLAVSVMGWLISLAVLGWVYLLRRKP